MKALRTARWRPQDRETCGHAINYDIEKAPDRSTQPKYYNLNDRIVNIHYYNELPVAIEIDNLPL
jgi:hypothetical protein